MRLITRPNRPNHRGFTLAEVLVSSALLALGFAAIVAACGHDSVATQLGENFTLGTYLTDEIRDMALRMDFAEVLDLDGHTFSPAVLSTGDSDDLQGWSQRVSVIPVSARDINREVQAADAQAACLAVQVLLRGKLVLAQAYCIIDMSGVRFAGEIGGSESGGSVDPDDNDDGDDNSDDQDDQDADDGNDNGNANGNGNGS